MNDIYCVTITKSYPDYKRPYTTNDVKFFTDKTKAQDYVKKIKREYYNDYLVKVDLETGDRVDRVEISDTEDPDKYDDEAYDIIYSDSYMDNEPFSYKIISVIENLDT